MTDFSWIARVRELSPAALTVRAQAISPSDTDRLLWDAFFPRANVRSTRVRDITTVDFRPVADRREWNARGRYIPRLTPGQREINILPVESYDKIEEQEMQELMESTQGNAEVVRNLIRVDIPPRIDMLASSIYRRIEVDAFSAWANGYIIQMNPQTGQTFQTSYGFSGSRYQTAGTAWNNVAVNAYAEFIAWCKDALDAMGTLAGAVMRQDTFDAIQADAPQGYQLLPLTAQQVIDRVRQDLAKPGFTFYIMEHSVDKFTDGGIATTRTKVWPAHKVAAVPEGENVGVTAFAPVYRAMQLAASVPEAQIDVRGVTITLDVAGAGRELTMEAQANPLPIPDEQRMFVIDAGV